VYYLVVSPTHRLNVRSKCSPQFLGVLVILLLLAACLAFRAFRIRRRYRTATQIALARGGPLPTEPGNEFWGMGGMAGWNAENTVRIDAGGRRGRGKTTRWAKIPILWENEVYEKVPGEEEDLEDGLVGTRPVYVAHLQPVMLSSQREEEPELPAPEPIPQPTAPRRTLADRLRRTPIEPSPPPPVPPPKPREIDRDVMFGEDISMAVIIRMPSEASHVERPRPDDDSFMSDEATGWKPGMEIGVWQGHVGDSSSSTRRA